MALSLYNDLTRKKEIFVPLQEGKVSFYSCGPTVYDYFHIGNARPFIVFDTLRRYLEFLGYDVTFVQNFTDIDDKMIERANREGVTVAELAERTIADYYEDADALGIKRATYNPRATEYMPQIIDWVQKLIDRGHAYEHKGTVYFDVPSFKDYGKLSRQNFDEVQSGARIAVDDEKHCPLDFVLWKPQKPGEPAWDSPWGKGRPGWHIECSVMSNCLLGETIDIHSGGIDLCFPHHENEIAQSEAGSGKPFVNFWIHNEYILIDKEKMSKSLGNFLTARAARQKYSPLAIRMFMLSAHYRSPINFTPTALEQATAAVERLRNCKTDLDFALKERTLSESDSSLTELIAKSREKYLTALDDDFNTAGAIGALFEAVREINTELRGEHPSRKGLEAALSFLNDADAIMGLTELPKQDNGGQSDKEIEALVMLRQKARQAKDFATSDRIRDELTARGILIEDTPDGPKWKREL